MEKNYKELVDARLSEALSDTASFIKIHSPDFNEGGDGTAAPDDAQTDDARFPSWLASGKARMAELEQHRRRRKKALSIATVFACAFFLASSLLFPVFLPPEETHADRNPDVSVSDENGSIVIGGDKGNTEMWTAVFASIEDVPDVYQKKMVWFDKLPEGYTVKEIKIKSASGFAQCEITYQAQSCPDIWVEEILHNEDNNAVTILNRFEQEVKINGLKVYVKTENSAIYHLFYYEGKEIYIRSGSEEKEEIEAMIASIRTD